MATSALSAHERQLRVSETIGERLRRLRVERGMSQRQLATPGASYAYISRVEAGTRRPSVRTIRMLARRLGVAPEYLETGEEVNAQDDRELRLNDAELALRLGEHSAVAKARLLAIVAEAEAAGDRATASRACAVLGMSALSLGNYLDAVDFLEKAVADESVSPLSQPEAYAALARAYVSCGATLRAIDLLQHCLAAADEATPPQTAASVRFAIYLSYALSDYGELDRAREILEMAVQRAEGLDDPYTQVRVNWSHARLLAAERRPKPALASLRRAIAILEATEDERQLGRAHLLYAEILTSSGDLERSERHLRIADNLLGTEPDMEDRYWLRAEQARWAARRGESERALALANEALSLIGDSDPAERGTALWAIAEANAAKGDLDLADAAFTSALSCLIGQRLWHEAGQLLESWVQVLEEAGRDDAARAVRSRLSELPSQRQRRSVRNW